MTLCIAALANDRSIPKIVLCSDMLLGDDYHGTETEFKADIGFSESLTSLYSGPWADATDLKRILKSHANAQALTLNNHKRILLDGLNDFKEVMAGIGKSGSDAQCIIAGFIEEEPQIIRVSIAAGVEILPDFATIGIGAYHADTILCWRKLTKFSGVEKVLYCAYEAKQFGQLCKDVGQKTLMDVLSLEESGLEVYTVRQKTIDVLHGWFKRFGPQQLDLDEATLPVDGFYRVALI